MVMSFNTERLTVVEITEQLAQSELNRIPKILTPAVVENLPPYFHNITSSEQARKWLEYMLLESRLLQITTVNHELIGFMFAHAENKKSAQIGYLLAEEYWGQGLASELLQGFIAQIMKHEPWSKLVAGVDPSNIASVKLLTKLGFAKQATDISGGVFYEYAISQPQSQ